MPQIINVGARSRFVPLTFWVMALAAVAAALVAFGLQPFGG